MEKRLGKIESVKFGHGGYQDAMIGIHVTLTGDSWAVGDSKSNWDAELIQCGEYTQWTEEERNKSYSDTVRYISKLLKEAKVDSIDKLKGKPVEVTFNGNLLKEWRILTEVL